MRFQLPFKFRKFIPSKRGLIKLLIILIIILSVTMPVVFYIEETPYGKYICNTCHSMKFYVASMEKDPHGNFSCMVCHERPRPLELVEMMYSEIRAEILWAPQSMEIFEKYHPQTHKNLVEHCNKCHEEKDVEKLVIHKYHFTVVETLTTCSICHVPHIKEVLNESCTKCHNYFVAVERHMEMHGTSTLQFASLNCARCHSDQSPAHVPLASVCIQASVEGKNCLACHGQLKPPDITDKPCITCHRK